MSYGAESIESRFDDFVEETNKKIDELESRMRLLQMELDKIKTGKNTNNIVKITNQDIKNSLGATIRSVGDIVK
jgi:sugar-specific transcriptional regulator TrmB